MKICRQLSLILILLMVSMGIPGVSYAESEGSEAPENRIFEAADEITDETAEEDLAGTGDKTIEDAAGLVAPDDESNRPDSESDPDSEELLMQYIDKNVDAETGRGASNRKRAVASNRRSRLSDYNKVIYDAIQTEVDKIASGRRDDSMLKVGMKGLLQGYLAPANTSGYLWKITSDSLGVDIIYEYKTLDDGRMGYLLSDEARDKFFNAPAVISALSADMPQSLYWFDKTIGYSYGLNAFIDNGGRTIYFKEDPRLDINFVVSKDYSKSGGTGTYKLDTTKTAAAAACIENVSEIINENSEKADYDKLLAYMNRICSLTSYNSAAANDSVDYGDPWQMIYVFDGNPDTNVVCEGYSKAFQYLCDKSDFIEDGIECHTVTGRTGGLHMWNLVRMDDGRVYIADITNCDAGNDGDPKYLFLTGCKAGDTYSGYTYKLGSFNVSYTYDQATYDLYSDEELLNPSIGYLDYKKIDSWGEPEYRWTNDLTTVTATRTGTASTESGKRYIDREVRHTVAVIKTPAQCTEKGVGVYAARFFYSGFEDQEKTFVIPETGHLWNGGIQVTAPTETSEGAATYTCIRCGQTYSEVVGRIIYPNDLPAAKISKPKAAKKKITVKWKKVSKKNQKKIQGVEIQVATDPAFTRIVKTTTVSKKKTSKSIKGLKSGTKYYVRIRSYRNAGDGKHVSSWKSQSIRVK